MCDESKLFWHFNEMSGLKIHVGLKLATGGLQLANLHLPGNGLQETRFF